MYLRDDSTTETTSIPLRGENNTILSPPRRERSVFMDASSQELSRQVRIQQAIDAVRSKRLGLRESARIHQVPVTTLHDRMKGRPDRSQVRANSHRLTERDEAILIELINEQDANGFPPSLKAICDAASRILESKGMPPAGKEWARRFINRNAQLIPRSPRGTTANQRGLGEDPEPINKWFQSYIDAKTRYSIRDSDTYDMDENGFQVGRTGLPAYSDLDRKLRHNRQEWITVAVCFSGDGFDVPPFFLLKGNVRVLNWYTDCLPASWKVQYTPTGRMDNDLAVEWVKHFDECTSARAGGRYRMLIADWHECHRTPAFLSYCERNRIIIVRPPILSYHLTQPHDSGFLQLFKEAYGREAVLHDKMSHMSKMEFFPAFKRAYDRCMTEETAKRCFERVGLIPFDPEVVHSKLRSRQRRPMESRLGDGQTS